MQDARVWASLRVDGGDVAPDHLVRPRDELIFYLSKCRDAHETLPSFDDLNAQPDLRNHSLM
jgi:hypothetical protein